MIGAKKSFINNNMSKQSIKDEKIGPFEAIKRVFPAGFGVKKPENLIQKCDLFFYDYTLMPLMVFENYLKASQPVGRSELDKLKAIAETADAMSFGDVIEKNIRTFNNWSLLPLQAAFSVAMPATFMNASLNAMPLFPSFLGRLSNYNKRERLLQELKCHMNLKVSGNKTSLSLDYLEPLRDAIIRRVKKGDIEGVVEFLNSYYLRKEDFDAIMELTIFTGEPDPYSKIDAKIKTALTRAINKSDQILPYSIGEDDIIQKKSKGKKAIGKKKIKSEEGNEEEPEETESDIPEVFE
jgi:replication factor C subunit 1